MIGSRAITRRRKSRRIGCMSGSSGPTNANVVVKLAAIPDIKPANHRGQLAPAAAKISLSVNDTRGDDADADLAEAGHREHEGVAVHAARGAAFIARDEGGIARQSRRRSGEIAHQRCDEGACAAPEREACEKQCSTASQRAAAALTASASRHVSKFVCDRGDVSAARRALYSSPRLVADGADQILVAKAIRERAPGTRAGASALGQAAQSRMAKIW